MNSFKADTKAEEQLSNLRNSETNAELCRHHPLQDSIKANTKDKADEAAAVAAAEESKASDVRDMGETNAELTNKKAEEEVLLHNLTSIEDVVQWFEALPDLTVDAELGKIHDALAVLKQASPLRRQIWPLCAAWKQPVKRNQKSLALAGWLLQATR